VNEDDSNDLTTVDLLQVYYYTDMFNCLRPEKNKWEKTKSTAEKVQLCGTRFKCMAKQCNDVNLRL